MIETFQMTPGTVFSFESQVCQYPRLGAPGIDYFAGVIPIHAERGDPPIDCLLWRDEQGLVRGILNHYPVDYPPHERAGNINLYVHPEWRRRGIATALLREAERRYGSTRWAQQRYSPDGLQMMLHYRNQGGSA